MILTAALILVLVLFLTRVEGNVAVVNINGADTERYSLSKDGEYPLNGGTNILVIEGGEAYIKSASCPDGLCVHYGKISSVGESIVCLPNRVMIRIEAEEK